MKIDTENSPITISERAAQEIKKMMDTKNVPSDYFLRVGVKGSRGCAGATLMLGFDKKKDGDMELLIKEINVLIQKREVLFIAGKEIEFYDEADARGFLFVDA